MRKLGFKKAIAVGLSALMVMSVPVTSFAATHQAGSWEELSDAFYDDEDADITIEMTADINCESTLTAQIGKTYTINGNTFLITGVDIVADMVNDGVATVVINADIVGDQSWNSSAITVSGSIDATVNGDVTGLDGSDNNWCGAGAVVYDGASLTVNGDAAGGSSAIDDDYGAPGIVVDSISNVTVNGDVTGGGASGENGTGGNGVLIYASHANDDPPYYAPEDYEATVGSICINGVVTGGIGVADNGYSLLITADAPFLPDELYDFDFSMFHINDVEELDFSDADVDEIGMSIEYVLMLRAICIDTIPDYDLNEGLAVLNNATEIILSASGAEFTEEELDGVRNATSLVSEEYIYRAAEAIMDQGVDAVNEFMMLVANMFNSDMSHLLADGNFALPSITLYGMQPSDPDHFVGAMVFPNEPAPQSADWPEMTDNSYDNYAAVLGAAIIDAVTEDINYIPRVAEPENGTVSTDKDTYEIGDCATITVTPDEGYEVDTVIVRGEVIQPDENGDYTYLVTDLEGMLDVSVTFKPIETAPEEPAETPEEPAETPEEPAETPAAPAEPPAQTPSGGVPTGDSSHIMLWVSLMGIALIAGTGAVVVNKKRV